MIERLYLKDHLSFAEAELEFQKGLVVFTGPSGVGKSVLMDAILSLFGIREVQGHLIEALVDAPVDYDAYGIEPDDVAVFKVLKKEKTRYFLNSQSLPKKQLKEIGNAFFRHINQKETGDFENRNLLALLDGICAESDPGHSDLLSDFVRAYAEFDTCEKQYTAICEEEKKVGELKEFAAYEIRKIDSVDPKTGEYDELMRIKKQLSKKEKIEERLTRAREIFECENAVIEVMDMLEVDSAFFTDAMQNLRIELENAAEHFSELEETDIGSLLERIESLSDLKRKYGSIEEALEYRDKKQMELVHYENLSFEKTDLEKQRESLCAKLDSLSVKLTEARQASAEMLGIRLNETLESVFLKNARAIIEHKPLDVSGADLVAIILDGTPLEQVSSGEFNRLRLALLAVKAQYLSEKGVLVLDEIDSNLSGEESEGVAKVLKQLSAKYQVFAISHQPHICILSDQHFLVGKEGKTSTVREIGKEEQVREIARMISGSEITAEAMEFAKKALHG